jgi:ribosomal protein S17
LEPRNGIIISEKYVSTLSSLSFSLLPQISILVSKLKKGICSQSQHFNATSHLLVHDPRSSLRIGDIISISPGWRVSKHVHHVVNSIIAPFGEPIEERPAVPSEEERVAEREAKKRVKDERRRGRRDGKVEGESA